MYTSVDWTNEQPNEGNKLQNRNESNKSTMMKDTLVETTDKQLKEIGIDWEEAECPRQEEK